MSSSKCVLALAESLSYAKRQLRVLLRRCQFSMQSRYAVHYKDLLEGSSQRNGVVKNDNIYAKIVPGQVVSRPPQTDTKGHSRRL